MARKHFTAISAFRESELNDELWIDEYRLTRYRREHVGIVYLARQMALGRTVALKMIRSGALADDREVKRFHTEAEAVAKLDHPGIVPVFDVGECSGHYFFSMAYVAGKSLAHHLLDDGPLSPAAADGTHLWDMRGNQEAHDVTGPFRVARNVRFSPVSESDRLAFLDEQRQLILSDGKTGRLFTDKAVGFGAFKLSPDGKQVGGPGGVRVC